MNTPTDTLHGVGLGLRRSFPGALAEQGPAEVDFYEIAPENWIGMGGVNARRLRALTERHPFVCHGLSLSKGADLIRPLQDCEASRKPGPRPHPVRKSLTKVAPSVAAS